MTLFELIAKANQQVIKIDKILIIGERKLRNHDIMISLEVSRIKLLKGIIANQIKNN